MAPMHSSAVSKTVRLRVPIRTSYRRRTTGVAGRWALPEESAKRGQPRDEYLYLAIRCSRIDCLRPSGHDRSI